MDNIVFYAFQDSTEIFVGESKSQIRKYLTKSTGESVSSNELEQVDGDIERCYTGERGELVRESLRALAARDIKKGSKLPYQIWTQYN